MYGSTPVGKFCPEWVEKPASVRTEQVDLELFRTDLDLSFTPLISLLILENGLKLELDTSDEEPFKLALRNVVF